MSFTTSLQFYTYFYQLLLIICFYCYGYPTLFTTLNSLRYADMPFKSAHSLTHSLTPNRSSKDDDESDNREKAAYRWKNTSAAGAILSGRDGGRTSPFSTIWPLSRSTACTLAQTATFYFSMHYYARPCGDVKHCCDPSVCPSVCPMPLAENGAFYGCR